MPEGIPGYIGRACMYSCPRGGGGGGGAGRTAYGYGSGGSTRGAAGGGGGRGCTTSGDDLCTVCAWKSMLLMGGRLIEADIGCSDPEVEYE